MRTLSLIIITGSLLSFACRPLDPESSETSFAAGEHKILGDEGYRNGCIQIGGCPRELLRNDRKERFTYGELVAFSGDFYADPMEIYNEKNSQSILHPTAANTGKIKKLFAEEEAAAKKQMEDPNVSYPDNNLGFTFAFPKYLELATQNVNHFGWNNMKVYVDYHNQAINMALEARKQTDQAKSQEMITRALFLNSFADHFLTDGFATGHIRNPRAQALKWQKDNNVSKTAVDSLAKLVHDNDHLLKDTHGPGLPVTNARGDTWETRCDGELFVNANSRDPQLVIPIEAVSLSVAEVLTAFRYGTVPEGMYAASALVPYPTDGTQPLIEIFNPNVPDEQIEAWLKSLGVISYFRFFIGLTPKLTRTFFTALPSIMDEFRSDVKKDSTDPNLVRRLAPEYIEGYLKVK